MEYAQQANIFKAVCDEKRLHILELLRDGEKCACVLIDMTDNSQSALSYHMKILCNSGIVTSRQDGKLTHYRICESGSKVAMDLLKDITSLNAVQTPNACYYDNLNKNEVI